MSVTFDKILGKPLMHTHSVSDITGLDTSGDSILSTSTNQTLTSSSANMILANASSGNVTIILPVANTVTNKTFRIKKVDSTLNTVTIAANGSETIDGDPNLIIQFQNSTAEVVSDGVGWYII